MCSFASGLRCVPLRSSRCGLVLYQTGQPVQELDALDVIGAEFVEPLDVRSLGVVPLLVGWRRPVLDEDEAARIGLVLEQLATKAA